MNSKSKQRVTVTAVEQVFLECERAREPSNLDSVVVCRRAVDGATNPNRSIEEALATAQKELAALRDAGVDVGAGDVRSVVRGSLLAYLASVGTSLDDAVTTQVDDLATGTITALLAAA
jgi:hypothetical protein